MAGIGGRIGLSTLIEIVVNLCRFYVAHSAKIIAYIQDTDDLTTEQKNTVLAWLNGTQAACQVLEIIQVVWE